MPTCFRWILLLLLATAVAAWCDPYRDPKSSAFEYQPPAGWSWDDEVWQNPQHHLAVNSGSYQIPEGFSLDAWAQAYASEAPKRHWENVRVLDATLGGIPAKCLIGVEQSDGQTLDFKMYLAIRAGVGGLLVFTSDQSEPEEYERVIGSVVESFHWL